MPGLIEGAFLAFVLASFLGAFAGFLGGSLRLGLLWMVIMFVFIAVETGHSQMRNWMWILVLGIALYLGIKGWSKLTGGGQQI